MSDTTPTVGGPQIDPYTALTPTQLFVWRLLLYARQDGRGMCRRSFALQDVYEVSNRISEIEQRLGITIERERCTVHDHRHRVVRYKL